MSPESTLNNLYHIVAGEFDIIRPEAIFFYPYRRGKIIPARVLLVTIMENELKMTPGEITRYFEDNGCERDRTTVRHYRRKGIDYLRFNRPFREQYNEVIKKLSTVKQKDE